MHHIGLQTTDKSSQPRPRDGIGLEPLPEHSDRNARVADQAFVRTAARERDDVWLEAIAGEPARQQRELLLRPGGIKRWDDKQNANHGFPLRCTLPT